MTFVMPDRDLRGLTQSLWAATAEPAPDCPPLDGDAKADVVVIGAGFAGLSTALHLAEMGTDVIVLEAMEPGFGASGRNGGQVISGIKDGLKERVLSRYGPERTERLYSFADNTASAVFDLIGRYAIACDSSQSGWIQGAHSAGAARDLERKARDRADAGDDVAYLDAAETARLTGTDWYKGAFLERKGGQLQPLSYARGLARAAMGQGVRLYTRSPVTALDRFGNRWRVTSPGGAVMAERVVMCTNGYTDTANLLPRITRSIIPVYSYQIATGPLSDNLRKSIFPEGHCLSDTRRLLAYCRFDADGRFLMGARGYIGGSLADGAFDLARLRLRELFPLLAGEVPQFFWNGRVAMTPDRLPRLMEPKPGLHVAMGWNGRGVAMTTAMGRVIADWLTGGSVDDLPIPLTPVRPVPFHGLRLIGTWVAAKWMGVADARERAAR